jgi:hypothetical protein
MPFPLTPLRFFSGPHHSQRRPYGFSLSPALRQNVHGSDVLFENTAQGESSSIVGSKVATAVPDETGIADDSAFVAMRDNTGVLMFYG